MVPDADIVVENFSAGTMNRMGLGYEALAAIKPDIIMASHSLAGLTGPWKHVKGHGPMGAAMAGLHYLAGYEDSDPIAPGQAFTDYTVNPYVSSYALMAALHHRRRTGKGQYIDLSQYESIVSTAGTTVLEYTALGRVRPRTGNRSPNAAPQGVYPCKPIHIDGQMRRGGAPSPSRLMRNGRPCAASSAGLSWPSTPATPPSRPARTTRTRQTPSSANGRRIVWPKMSCRGCNRRGSRRGWCRMGRSW